MGGGELAEVPTAWTYRQPWGDYVTMRWGGRRLCSLTPPGSSARPRGWGTTTGHTCPQPPAGQGALPSGRKLPPGGLFPLDPESGP